MTNRVWEFPKDRFVEYGPEDLSWAKACNYGRWVTKPMHTAYRVLDTLVMHPELWDRIKKMILMDVPYTNGIGVDPGSEQPSFSAEMTFTNSSTPDLPTFSDLVDAMKKMQATCKAPFLMKPT
jgi:hypothetical protein